MVRECRPPAREPGRSWLARRSTFATSIPASASSPASISPVGPPPGDHHRMPRHSHTPAGITPVATSASHLSALTFTLSASTRPMCRCTSSRSRATLTPLPGLWI